MHRSIPLFACALIVVAGCAEDAQGPSRSDDVAAAPADASGHATDDTGAPKRSDEGEPVFVEEDATDVGVVADEGDGPAPEGFADPCAGPEDCDSGLCVDTEAGNACTIECIDSCPSDWTCRLLQNDVGDPLFLCLPPDRDLCRPCGDDAQCGNGGRCVAFGEQEGSFCGAACQGARDCPAGYGCEEVADADGAVTRQCLPAGGACACTEAAIDRGDATPCQRSNEHGTCAGERRCEAAGLSGCDAPVPAAEACNGADDDCDGETDEGFDDLDADGAADCVDSDDDGDGTPDDRDVCPARADPDQADLDGDGRGDACDTDDDGDGVGDEVDGCPRTVDPDQEDLDGDGRGDVCDDDDDGDGIPDVGDVCPTERDPLQEDLDGDGLGDACDDDDDGDGVDDTRDGCPTISDPDQADLDEDRIGDACDPDTDGDGDLDADDCAPRDAAIHRGARERCNGRDDDCDGQTDEEDAAGCQTWFHDGDGDGHGRRSGARCLCGPEGAWTTVVDGDCNDSDAAIHPSMAERCNGLDDDCDGQVDPENAADCTLWFRDFDADGWGRNGETLCRCAPFAPFSASRGGDCNDTDDRVHPGADEPCNGRDEDCDGEADDGHTDTNGDGLKDCIDPDDDDDLHDDPFDNCPQHPNPDQADLDGDGLGDACDLDDDGDGAADASDCAPRDPAVRPLTDELCDGIDNDCDRQIDEGFDDTDGDGEADCVDTDDDGDGAPDIWDNCPFTPNPEQEDRDRDEIGDACDID